MPPAVPARHDAAEEFCCAPQMFATRPQLRRDPIAQLVRHLAADPDNAYNLDPYLWVLEEAAPEPCEHCGTLFLPSFDYRGAYARGQARRYCSEACAQRATTWRRTIRTRRTSAA
jgi:hypothetical protein